MGDNAYRTRPYERADLNRLNPENYLTAPLNYWTLMEIIKSFKNKAPGESKINKEMIDKLPRVAKMRLKKIIDILLSMGYFTRKYKSRIMIFTGKEGKDLRDPKNYRPITLLEVPGKILEKVVNIRFVKYIEENNILNKNQYGFRKDGEQKWHCVKCMN